MEIRYNLDRELCIVWLRNNDKDDAALHKVLEATYQANKASGYRTVVFYSGTQELYASTRDLLCHNKRALS